MKTCQNCQSLFDLIEKDRQFLTEMATTINGQIYSIPEPTLCPDCRMQKLVAFRNEMNFHRVKDDLTSQSLLTNVVPDQGYKVISSEAFFGDQHDPLQYGREFDFSRPFFEQFAELLKAVPHPNLLNSNCDNSDYCNHAVHAKDCYLSARIGHSEKAYYSYLPIRSYNIFDCYFTQKVQQSYEVIDCQDCHEVTFSQRLKSCQDVHFSMDMIGCESCFGCYGLRHKKYHFFNQPMSKDEYFVALKNLDLGSHAFTQKIRNKFYQEEVMKYGLRHATIENSENALGNYIYGSRNIDHGFDVNDSQDIHFGWGVQDGKDCLDVYAMYYAEKVYNTVSCFESQNIKFSYLIYKGCYDLEYCIECFNGSKDSFGSVGLKHEQYCILNKRYSKKEYFELKGRIIEHMKSTGEYGQFFPLSISPYAYSESVGQEYFPLSQEGIQSSASTFFERSAEQSQSSYQIPDHVKDVQDDIVYATLICEKTGRPYRIIPQELKFLRQYNLPIPRVSPYQRHIDRIQLRGPRKLFDRNCDECQVKIQTTYSLDRPEKVLCKICYLKQVY